MLNFTRTECGLPAADHRHQVRVVTLTMFALATVFFLTRMVVKYLRFTKWGADDTWITVGYVRLRCHLPSTLRYPCKKIMTDPITAASDSLNIPYPIE